MAAALCAGCAFAASPVDAQLTRLFAEKRWAQALGLIEAELARNPGDVQRRLQKGVVLTNLNRQADALVVFRKLTAEHPELPGPYNNVAVLLAARGEFEQAREALERAIHTHPTYATAYENLGDLYSHMATDAYRKALRYEKQPANVRPKLALVDGMNGALAPSSEHKAVASASSSAAAAASQDRTSAQSVQASATALPASGAQAGAPAVKPPLPVPPTAAPVVAAAPATPVAAALTAGTVPAAKASASVNPPAVASAVVKAPAAPSSPPPATPPAPSAAMSAAAPVVVVAAGASRPSVAVAPPAKAGSGAVSPAQTPGAATAAPVAAPGKAGAARNADEDRALRQALGNWAQAWSRRDMNGYFAAYTADFKGKAKSHAAWRTERQDRITGKKRIEVSVSDLAVKVQGTSAEVRFTQAYESDALRVVSRKVLNFEKIGSKWLIQQESAGR